MKLQQRSLPAMRTAALVLLAATLSACGSVQNLLDDSQGIDYQSATQQRGNSLEVPPDLTQLARDNRYTLPERGTATFSQMAVTQPGVARMQAAPVLPDQTGMRIERAGDQRWLVVDAAPETLYPLIRQFWQDMGFLILIDLPQAGIIETDWAENRANIPQDIIRRTIGRVFDALYSTGERDKFRTRLERNGSSTEIFISHRGAREEVLGTQRDRIVWMPRDADPELEAEFLNRLMVALGADQARAQAGVQAAASGAATQPRARFEGSAAAPEAVLVDEGFDRAWRRVGVVLDRTGFTVEDRDRSAGIYFVRYVDLERDANDNSGQERGMLGRLFSFGRDDDASPEQFRISVQPVAQGGSRVAVLDGQGQAVNNATSRRILAVLHDQLRF